MTRLTKKEKLNNKDNLVLSNLRAYYETKEKIGSDNCNIIFNKSKKVIEKIIESIKKKESVGMLFGKVQSGKTLNYITYIVYAFLEDIFDIVIILNATNNDLYDQNRDRIKKVIDFLNEGEDIEIRFEEITKIGYKFRTISKGSIEGKKTIICSLKEAKNIQKILDWLENYQYDENSKQCPRVLIIDDEGDQASLSNIKKKVDNHANGEDKKEAKKQRTVNERLVELKNCLNAFFLSVTATPYANMLLSTNDPLSPNFIEEITPGLPYNRKRYLGIRDVWGNFHNKIIRKISEDEASELEKVEFKEKSVLPESLKKAISTFLVISQALGKNFRMWIHTRVDTTYHRIVTERVNEFIRKLKEWVCEDDLSEFIEPGFLEIEGKNLYQFSKVYKKKILGKIRKLIDEIEVKEINSKSDSQRWQGGKPYVNEIIIGSKLLDRGVTIEYLAVAYITISSNNADTTLQRARWFGYKSDEIINKFLRVWCTERIDNDYFEIKKMEESFHEDIEFINNNGLSVKDWGAGDREKTFFIGNEGRWLTRKTIKQVKSKFLNFTQYKVKNDEKEEWEFLERMENNLPSAKKIYDRDFKENEYKTLDEFEKDAPDKILKKVLEKCDIPRNF